MLSSKVHGPFLQFGGKWRINIVDLVTRLDFCASFPLGQRMDSLSGGKGLDEERVLGSCVLPMQLLDGPTWHGFGTEVCMSG